MTSAPVLRPLSPRLARIFILLGLTSAAFIASRARAQSQTTASGFHIEEATIADIQPVIQDKRQTATDIVKFYLGRSMNDKADTDPALPDALEVTAAEDAAFAQSAPATLRPCGFQIISALEINHETLGAFRSASHRSGWTG